MMVDKRKFKDTNVSLLGLGTMRLPCETKQKRESNPNIDYDKAQSLVDLAYKNGVNYFDTAYMYHCGKSEAFIGYALKKYPRNTYFIPRYMLHSYLVFHKLLHSLPYSLFLQIHHKNILRNFQQ